MGARQLAAVPHDAPPDIEAALRGQYTILETIGGGGMSRVWLARERALDRVVAIKVLRPELRAHRDDCERFRREARVLASLRHPGIMPVHSLGEAAGTPYFVMPYVAGPCLARRLADGTRLTEPEACALLADLADALDAAHRAGVVHRDIKPENILLENGRPILADFGVAILHTSDHSRSEAGRGYGTLAYMAPEQVLGQADGDARGDIYSLGVVAFQLLAGRTPFTGQLEREVAAQHVVRPAPRVSVFRPGIAPGLDDLILRCLAKDPADRWPAAADLRDALEALSSGTGICASRDRTRARRSAPGRRAEVPQPQAVALRTRVARFLPWNM